MSGTVRARYIDLVVAMLQGDEEMKFKELRLPIEAATEREVS